MIKFIFSVLLASTILLLTACGGGGGGGNVSISHGPGGGGGGAAVTLTPETIMNPSGADVSLDDATLKLYSSDGYYYMSTHIITIKGTCSRGVVGVSATVNATLDATGVCTASGTFTWTKTVSTDGDYDVVLIATDVNGADIAGTASTTYKFHLDTTAPNVPVFDSPYAGTSNMIPYNSSSDSVTITGTISSADVISVLGLSNAETYSAGIFSQSGIALTANSTLSVTFTAYDRAGNSSSSTAYVQYLPDATLAIAGPYLGAAVITSAGTSLDIEATMNETSAISVTSSPAGFTMYTGLNNIINQLRAE